MSINHFSEYSKLFGSTIQDIIEPLQYMYSRNEVFPEFNNIFKAFQLCPLSELKVVILSQDPYSDKVGFIPRATGIAFANDNKILDKDISPSLKVLKESIINFEMPHNSIIFANNLEEWSKQGILLLNSALTVEKGKPGSHLEFWRPFISNFLQNLSMYYPGLVYLLLGNEAKSFKPYINERYNNIIEEKHPSWYARNNKKMPYDLFPKIAHIVYMQTGYRINWFKENTYES